LIELALPGARVLFTGRAAGDVREPEPAARLEAEVGRRLARGRQVHGAIVRRLVDPPGEVTEADGQATARADAAPTVQVADCLPIAVAGGGAVAMLHAGWRWLAAGIVEEGVRALRELAEPARSLRAVIGPGARSCCYEVGPEVHAALGRRPAGAATIDLPAIAERRLREAGVAEVEDTGLCTICDERFFSHRREGAEAGRQAGVVWTD
jgi:YfiH family protein